MASCITAQWDTHKATMTSPQMKLTVTEQSSTGAQSVLAWTLQYIASYPASTSGNIDYKVIIGGSTAKESSYDINGKTGTYTVASGTVTIAKSTSAKSVAFSVTAYWELTWSGVYCASKVASSSISVPAKTSYTVKYNANGGSGAPSSQTKWYGTALTLSSTKPTRTGYTFKGWATSASGSVAYAAGASYTANAAVTLYAVWQALTYTVSYNANGGSGAPSSQTKTYGTALTLSSTKPTRTNYNFLGWGTSASSTTVSYAAGASYTANAAITLYAVWELAYVKPRISGLTVSRCDASGAVSEEGTCALVVFDWACDQTVSGITIAWESSSATGSTTVTASGTSGSVSEVVGESGLSADATYTFRVVVTDGGGSSEATTTLNGTAFSVDFLAGGNGVAFGKPAEKDGVAEFALDLYDKFGTKIGNGLAVYQGGDNMIDADTTIEHCIITTVGTPDTSLWYVLTFFYTDKSDSGNRAQLAIPYRWAGPIYHRYRYSSTWSDWVKNLNEADEHDHPYSTTASTFKFTSGWMGLYDSVENAQTHTSQKAYIGFNGGTVLKVADLSSGGVDLRSGGTVRLFGKSDSVCVAVLNDRMRSSANDTHYLGDSTYRWKAVYAVNGTIQTSDRNQKENIQEIDQRYIDLFDKLQPVSFEFNDAESDRVHIGFVSQDVKAAMDEVGLTDLEFAGYCRDALTEWDEETQTDKEVLDEGGNPIHMYSLRYSEFIALNSKMIQMNREKIASQQQEINTLKTELAELKKIVTALTTEN